jgi:hypothetical protein
VIVRPGASSINIFAAATCDKPAQDVLLADDINVEIRVGGAWNKAEEVAQILGSTDLL